MGSRYQVNEVVNRTFIMYFNNVLFVVMFLKSIYADSTLDVFQSFDEYTTLPSSERTTYTTYKSTKDGEASEPAVATSTTAVQSTTQPTTTSTYEVATSSSLLTTTQTTYMPSTSTVTSYVTDTDDSTTHNNDDMTAETTPIKTSTTSTGFETSPLSTTVEEDTKTTVQPTVESTTTTAETTETTMEPVTSTASPSSGNGKLRLLYILLAIFGALILVLVAAVLYCFRKRRSRMLLLESSGSEPSGKIVPIA